MRACSKEYFWSRLCGVCIASVWSLKKLGSPRTQSHDFWQLWEVSQALQRVLLYWNSNKPVSLTKETYVAMYFENVFPNFWRCLGVGRGNTRYCLCDCCNRNAYYLTQSCSLGPQFVSESFQLAVPRSVWCQWELFALHLKEGMSITVLTEIITKPKKLLFATADACCQ